MNTIIPRMSEKSFMLSNTRRTYIFDVSKSMNRSEVAKAVEELYNVKVDSVNISLQKGKAVRFIRRGGRVNTGVRSDIKKAYVRLVEGNALPIFAAIEEEIKEEQKADKTVAAPEQKKRGIFGRKNEKATKTSGAATQVTRTQAKVGEK